MQVTGIINGVTGCNRDRQGCVKGKDGLEAGMGERNGWVRGKDALDAGMGERQGRVRVKDG